jgi:preprotein translocase subunit YajC
VSVNLLKILEATVVSQTTQQSGVAGILNMLLPFALIFGVFYFLVILPQKKQQKKHLEMLNTLQKGDSVLMSNGFFGRITEVKDDGFKVEIAPKVVVKVQKSVVVKKIVEVEEENK